MLGDSIHIDIALILGVSLKELVLVRKHRLEVLTASLKDQTICLNVSIVHQEYNIIKLIQVFTIVHITDGLEMHLVNLVLWRLYQGILKCGKI